MAAPLNNKNALGKETGRKSAYQEKVNAEFLNEVFFGVTNKVEIEARITSGQFSVCDVFILKALNGSERVLSELFRKIFPDKALLEERKPIVEPFSLTALFNKVKEVEANEI